MDFKEIETKYHAGHISLADFVEFADTLNPEWLMISSYDDYFVNSAGDFIRYRYHDAMGELTIKRKTKSANNTNRIEVNIPTEGKDSKTVAAFINLLGYKFNFSIFKTCKIAVLDKITLVYYVVYDDSLKEKYRFIEIEAHENHPWSSEEEAWNEILKYEKMLKSLNITAKNRMRKSLFELFKK